MNREEVKKIRAEKKAKKAIRYRKGRHLRNFIIWLVGFLSSFVVVAAAAFICVGVVPIGNYFGENTDDYVSADISSKTLLQAVKDVQNYKVGDLPVLTNALESLINEHNLDDYMEIDMDKLKEIRFVYSDGEKNLSTELQACLKVTASLKSLSLTSMLGALGELEPFVQWTPVTNTIDIENDFTGNNKYNMYYYVPSTVVGEPTDKDYEPALTLIEEGENSDKVAWASDEAATAQLYYANLSVIPITDALSVLPNSIGVLKVVDLLGSFSDAPIDTNSLIYDVIGDSTISQMGELSANNVKLSKVLGEQTESNKTVYNVLMELAGVTEADALTIGALTASGMDIGVVHLSTIFPLAYSPDLYEVLESVTGKARADILISDLSAGVELDDVALSSVLPEAENEALYKILNDAVTPADPTKGITIADLSNLEINKVFLSTVITDTSSTIFDILVDVIPGVTSAEDIKVSHLTGTFDFSGLQLSDVITETEAPDLYALLKDIYPNKDATDLTIGDVSSFSPDDIHLGAVLASGETEDELFSGENAELYKILNDAVNVAGYNEAKGYEEGDDEYVKSVAYMKIGDLSTYLEIENIKLKTVIGDTYAEGSNTVLDALLKKDGTVGSLSDDINDISLEEIFPAECFIVVEPDDRADYEHLYYKSATENKYYLDTYVYNLATEAGVSLTDYTNEFWLSYERDLENGGLKTYYVNPAEGAWFFMFYHGDLLDQEAVTKTILGTSKTVTGYTGSGLANIYSHQADVTFGEMDTAFSTVTNELTHSTVRELLDLGLLSTEGEDGLQIDFSNIKAFTIEQAIRFGNDLMSFLGLDWGA